MKMLNYVLIFYFCSCSWPTFGSTLRQETALLVEENLTGLSNDLGNYLFKMYIYIFVYVGECVYIYISGANPRLIGSDSSGIGPSTSLSGTLLWFSPQILENSWSICSDWSSSNSWIRYQNLAQSQVPRGCCLFLGILNLLGSELTLLSDRDECSPHFAMMHDLG